MGSFVYETTPVGRGVFMEIKGQLLFLFPLEICTLVCYTLINVEKCAVCVETCLFYAFYITTITK